MGRVKGSVIVGVVKAIKYYDALELTPKDLHHHFDQKILESSWYDEDEYLKLMLTLAEVLQRKRTSIPELRPGVEIWDFIGRTGAQGYFQGPYKSLLRKGNPGTTLKNYEILWRVRHDTGVAKVTLHTPETAQIETSDYCLISGEICLAAKGTYWSMLSQAGAEDISISKSQCRARGDATCLWSLSWQNPAAATTSG